MNNRNKTTGAVTVEVVVFGALFLFALFPFSNECIVIINVLSIFTYAIEYCVKLEIFYTVGRRCAELSS